MPCRRTSGSLGQRRAPHHPKGISALRSHPPQAPTRPRSEGAARPTRSRRLRRPFGQLLIYLFQTARRFNMEVQPSLVLLQKTLLNIEGLGRQLYPQLDLWTTAQPYLENWMRQRYSPQGLLERLRRNAPSWLEQLPQLPDAVLESLQHSRELETQTQQQQQQLESLQAQVQREDSRRKRMVIAMLLFGGAAATAFPEGVQQMSQWPLLSWGLLGIGLYLLWPRSQP